MTRLLLLKNDRHTGVHRSNWYTHVLYNFVLLYCADSKVGLVSIPCLTMHYSDIFIGLRWTCNLNSTSIKKVFTYVSDTDSET